MVTGGDCSYERDSWTKREQGRFMPDLAFEADGACRCDGGRARAALKFYRDILGFREFGGAAHPAPS